MVCAFVAVVFALRMALSKATTLYGDLQYGGALWADDGGDPALNSCVSEKPLFYQLVVSSAAFRRCPGTAANEKRTALTTFVTVGL
jgi:hypothetical protein